MEANSTSGYMRSMVPTLDVSQVVAIKCIPILKNFPNSFCCKVMYTYGVSYYTKIVYALLQPAENNWSEKSWLKILFTDLS